MWPMQDQLENSPPSHKGFTHEHILLSVRIAHKREVGQFDDASAHLLTKAFKGYNEVYDCEVTVLYDHGKEDACSEGCECWKCSHTRNFPFNSTK